MTPPLLRLLAVAIPSTLTLWSFVGHAHAMFSAPPPAAPTARAAPPTWTPPSWFPDDSAFDALEGVGRPGPRTGVKLRSRAVLVYDVDAGEVLYERGADDVRPVASLTKLVSALTLASTDPDLDVVRCVTPDVWPSRPGARSKFSTGECYTGWDYLGAALVRSDNRAAYAMHVLSGLPYRSFVSRMTEVSRDLGMWDSTWADPSGLDDNNLSTARDLTRAALAVSAVDDLAVAATAPMWSIAAIGGAERHLFSTNRLAARDDLEVLAAKTGYTDTAGYCFSGVVRTRSGRTIAMTTLAAPRSSDRWRDVDRVLRWVDGS